MSKTYNNTQEIWAKWNNGEKECVDTAESEAEALVLLSEYRMAYGSSVRLMWLQLSGHDKK